MENNKYYVYVLLDKSKPGIHKFNDLEFEYEPFYVGKGTGDRIITTLIKNKSFYRTHKHNRIKSIKNRGYDIIAQKIYENLGNEESLEIEKKIIKLIGRRDLHLGTLTNLTDGGDGRLESPHSKETKEKISKTKKEQALSIPHTEETKNILREINKGDRNPMYGKTHTDEVKEQQSLRVSGSNHPMFGKNHTDESIAKIKESRNKSVDQNELNRLSKERNSKSILQYDLEGIFIDEYESIKVAAEKTGLSESLIGKTCRGIVKNPRKFIFKFKNTDSNTMNNSYEYKVGDFIFIDAIEHKFEKRNKTTCIVSINGVVKTLRKKEYEFLWDKKIIKNE